MELKIFIFYTLLSFAFLLFSTLASTDNNNKLLLSDRSALLGFKKGVTSDPSGALLSWNDTISVCEWEGVKCSTFRPIRVIALQLDSRGLTGSISPSLTNLTSLVSLTLINNAFNGEIPGDIGRLHLLRRLNLSMNSLSGRIPDSLSNCSALMSLILLTNHLSGSIPSGLGNLPNLYELILARNNLTGHIPASLGNASSLGQLSLLTNFLDGSIPDALGRLPKMRIIQFSINRLTGVIPPSIFNLSSLRALQAASNLLEGSLPPDMGTTLPALQILLLGDNKFQGGIPPSLANASRLTKVDLGFNNFSGPVPSHLGRLTNLSILSFGFNNLDGDGWGFLTSLTNCSRLQFLVLNRLGSQGAALPNSVGNLSTQLNQLVLSANGFVGKFPLGMDNLVNLQTLYMGGNQFTDVIPESIGKLQKLQLLTLPISGLAGRIPSSLGNLTQLLILDLSYNGFTGSIPSSLGNLQQLSQLDMSNNRLTGNIPKHLLSIASLTDYLDLSTNSLVGPLPAEVGSLKNLKTLNMSRNKLSGGVPITLGNCEILEALDIGDNQFSGTIPSSLSNIKGLQLLNLSHNNLSGVIPKSLQQLQVLSSLDLSFNQLHGEVPTGGVFDNATAVSLVGNDQLCSRDSDIVANQGLPDCAITTTKGRRSGVLKRALLIAIPLLCFVMLMSCFILFYGRRHWRREKPSTSASIDDDGFHRISYRELLNATNGFSSANLVGRGSYASVFRGTLHLADGLVSVAVKVFDLGQRGGSKSFMAECEALRSIRHRNLIRILTSCSSVDSRGDDFKALVFEFMPNGSLEEWLHPADSGQGTMSLVQRLNVAVDVADALNYLHHDCQPPVVHCDLKPSNVLIDEEFSARVGDFGLSRFLSVDSLADSSLSTAMKGSIGYLPPEYGAGAPVSTSGDVYSYGILLLEMFSGKRPVNDMFKDGLQLREFVDKGIPDRVMEIIDTPLLLVLQDDSKGGRIQDCVMSVLRVGLHCSNASPRNRIDMQIVASEVHSIRDAYLKITEEAGKNIV